MSIEQEQKQGTSHVQIAEVVAATQLGSQLGTKARRVLAYLNSIRSLDYDAYTVPVGYSHISTAAGVDPDYLRRKVLPKLAMLGLIAVARKSLEGTVYHLPHRADYVWAVTGELVVSTAPETADTPPLQTTSGASEKPAALPEWIDKEQWGWLSLEGVQRLVEKAGSEPKAKEKLDIIVYNETHGSPEQRVRNRRSVLAHYLSAPQAEIWPNDDGFETLEMRQVRRERDRAQREKTLAEEATRAREEAERAKFVASLSEAQLRWLKQKAKQRVDARPDAKFLGSRYPLYKAEEETVVREWMDRVAYGETVPATGEETAEERS
jgi:hypothetical protein